MFGRKIFRNNCLLLIFIILFLLHHYGVQAETNVLPTCANAVNAKTPASIKAKCLATSGELGTANYVCINSSKTEIYKTVTSPSDSCSKISLTDNAYYIFDCADVAQCTLKAVTDSFSGNILIYQYKSGQLIQLKNNKYYLQGTKMLSCLKGVSFPTSFNDNGKCTNAADGIYINPDTDSTQALSAKPLVKVTGGDGTASTSTGLTITAGNYYVDQSSKNGDNYSKLIYCSSATSCQSITPSDGIYINADDSKQISCTSGSCTSGNAVSTAIYLNPAVSGDLTKAFISCTSGSTCTTKDGVDKKYYMEGTNNSGTLIKCTTAEGCRRVIASTTAVYLDEGSESSGYTKVIKCQHAYGDCELVSADENVYAYIDGDNNHNLIISGSSKYTSSTKTSGFYIDKLNTKNVISCTSDGCTSSPGSTLKGHHYIDGTDATGKTLITYDSNGGASDTTLNTALGSKTSGNTYFIDGSNPKKIINCTGAAGGATCALETPDLTGKVLKFYESDSSHTITCSSDGCIYAEGLPPCKSAEISSDEALCKDSGDGDVTNGNHCIHEDGKIYKSETVARKRGNSCAPLDLSKTYIFTADGSASTFSSTSGTDVIYTCDDSKCLQVVSSSYKDDPITYLYSCDNDGACSKETLADGNVYLSGVATISTTQPYLTYGLTQCSKSGGTFDVSDCKTVSNPSGHYINTLGEESEGNPSFIIKCINGKCLAVDAGNNSFYASASEKLIKCGNGNGCAFVADVTNDSGTDYTKGYLLDYSGLVDTDTSTKLISCNSTKCVNPTITDGYYIDMAGNSIIHCVNGSCKTASHNAAANSPIYYLDATTKKVIQCTNGAKCTLIDKPLKGYYLNSGNPEKPVIQCTGASTNPCSEASAIVTNKCDKVGNIISDTGIFICFSDDNTLPKANAAVQIQSTGNPLHIAYKTLFLEDKADFPGASQKTVDVKINNDGSAYILEEASLPICGDTCDANYCIKESSGKVLIYTNGGSGSTCTVITVDPPTTNAIVYSTLDGTSKNPGLNEVPDMAYSCTYGADGKATKCELVKGYTQAASNTVQCSGWKNDPCTVVVTSSLNTACADSDDGTLGQFSSKLSVCFSDDATYGGINLPTDVSTTTYTLFYTTEINPYYGWSKNMFLPLALTSKSVIVTKATEAITTGYQINRGALPNIENALINCQTAGTISSCSSVDGRIGRYYLNSGEDKSNKKLIECSSAGCKPITNKESYFLDGEGDNSKIIQCKTETSFTCSRINHNGTSNSPKYYVNNSNDEELITCTDAGCKISEVVVKGYFLNGSGTSGKTLIECDGTDCIEKDDTSFASLNKIGNLMVSTNGVSICVATGCSGKGVEKVGYTSSDTYKTINVKANDDFIRGTLAGNPYTIKIGKDGSVILLEEMGAFNTCGAGNYCFDGNDKKIKYGGNSSSDVITSEEAGTKIYYFNPVTKQMVDNIPSSGTIPDVIAYKCTFILTDDEDINDNKVVVLDTCQWIRGFVIDGTNTIQCSGWKHEGCTISSSLKSCEDGDEGRLGSGKKICFGKAMIDISKVNADDTDVVFLSKEININYGKAASSIVSLSITSNSVLVADNPTINTKYVIKVGDEFKLYSYDAGTLKYTLDKTTTIISTLEIIRGYTYESNDIFEADASILFNCYQGICVRSKGFIKDTVDSKLYSSDVTNISNDPDWKEVSSDDQACTTNEHIGHVTGTVTLCVPDRTANANPPVKTVTVGNSVYFLGSETSYKLYNSITNTISIVDPSDGYYLVDASDKLETSTGEGSLYLCSKKACEKKATPDIGYYINAGNQKMIACAEETVNGEKVTKCKLKSDEGYYINNNKELIHCISNKCELSDEIGYFVNGNTVDTENPIIQCGIKGCEAIAIPAAGSIQCNSDAQIGKLDSDKKVCLNNNSVNPIKTNAISGSEDLFIISYSTSSVFKNYISKNTYFGLVTVVQNKKITLNFDNTESIYCVKKDIMKIVADADCTDAALTEDLTHEKYICNVDGVCLPQTETTETLPESVRGQKSTDDSEEEKENTSASDFKIECDVLTGKNCNLNTYYLINKSINYAVNDDSGSLFYCTTENTPCQEIRNIGYYIINENYVYTCKEYGTEVECSREDVPSQESITTCSAVGKLYKNSNKLYMCVFTNTSIELNTISSNGNYVIEKDTDNVFGLSGTETHAIVNIQDKKITLNADYNNKLGFVYSNLKKNAQVLEKGSSSCPTKGSGATLEYDTDNIKEYKCTFGKCSIIA